jgi:hypothetical protein
MATYYDSVETSEGIAHVLTKTRYLRIIPLPRTSIMPHKGSELGRLGTAITWATKDAAILRTLHSRIVELVREFGVSGIREIANYARMSDHVAKAFGGSWRDVVASAAQDGVSFPMPDDVLRYVKGFV